MTTDDPVVDRVIQLFAYRSALGMRKFGMSMEQNDAPVLDWIDSAQEELMDAILYLERLKKEFGNGRVL